MYQAFSLPSLRTPGYEATMVLEVVEESAVVLVARVAVVLLVLMVLEVVEEVQ